jgi:hypothetical protein
MELIKFLEKAQTEGVTTVSGLITAINSGSCDSWESFRALDYWESLATSRAGGVKARRFQGRK